MNRFLRYINHDIANICIEHDTKLVFAAVSRQHQEIQHRLVDFKLRSFQTAERLILLWDHVRASFLPFIRFCFGNPNRTCVGPSNSSSHRGTFQDLHFPSAEL